MVCFVNVYVYLKSRCEGRKIGKERGMMGRKMYLPAIGSLPRCLQLPKFAQAKSRGPKLQVLGALSATFSGTLTGSRIRSRVARDNWHSHVGCRLDTLYYSKQRVHVLERNITLWYNRPEWRDWVLGNQSLAFAGAPWSILGRNKWAVGGLDITLCGKLQVLTKTSEWA